ncbi:bifunctional alpha,alpha-trehalose-phosphate synthase (UDP-forming)/trehalose-phosphatase [Cyclobacteriaceae bacterium]|nr:bifunctional alpha,alpha-trehalose-phosphate synthase (UDP-forming)/trehalose-phosphatase [Cyclobacteriaceae bacterium]MDB4315290.1 bifunctional alpha,alpha-trehalose-phosphate synthase (UDP-forming)/trehalose-phosphatase [Cyclobacteriaceae bacterium]MDB4603000.1 bifunctional alpha,alpha-trehalose-phosphate synthase (UDP-forming)/trehalose-phosphatase [Cyclobacteriaceae bacterium]
MGKTIIISNRLPVKIEQENNELVYKASEGGLATGLNSVFKQGNNLWVGWPGLAIEKSQEEEVHSNLIKQHMKPVFLSTEEIEDFYEGFSNETLWPNFHYFNQYTVYKEELWLAYQRVNQKFAEIVSEELEDDDTVWIHDYQLLLLPQLIRAISPNATIGFFLHIPFPSYESFRLLPWRRELLNGMLGADFLGFHTYDDMRHFLSSVNRLAGLGNSNGTIKVKNRLIKADALPMGIDYEKYAASAQDPETLAREARYRESIGTVKLILSIDRLDYSKGIPQRLRAFELFLSKYPDFKEKVSLFMVVVPSRDSVSKYKQLKEEIDLLVGRINGQFSKLNWTPIHYFYRSFPLPALSAFYRISDVALVSPMRDGMNLVCKEYVASRLDKKGVLILSEMAGASKELSDAIIVNPNDIHQLVEAMHKALTMPEALQIESMTSMQKSLKRYNIHAWVKLFMDELANVKKEQSHLKTRLIDNQLSEEIKHAYKQSKERLIFLDYDGTLVGFNENPDDSKPDQELIEILERLTKDKKNHIVIISGRGRQFLEEWMKPYSLDIVAEHGVWIKRMGKPFKTFIKINASWKKETLSLLERYVNRTPGSFVEAKDYSLVWHYRKVETGLGEVRTRELTSHLKYMTANENLEVLEGDMIVEIKNSEINKGKAAQKLMEIYPEADFLLALGDDFTDEDTFKAMPEEACTIKVGTSASEAKFSVNSYKEVRKLLNEIIKS